MKSPIQDPCTSPSHFLQTREPSSEGNPYVSRLGIDPGSVSYAPSMDNIHSTLPRPISAPLYETDSDSDPDATDHPLDRQTSGRSSSNSRYSTRSSLDYRHKGNYTLGSISYINDSTGSEGNLLSRRKSDDAVRDREAKIGLHTTRLGSLPGMLREEGEDEEEEEWGKGRHGTMTRRRKRDKTTGETGNYV